ncbi:MULTISPECIES: 2-dehydropantoate 2-reductase [unclassified Beijerinckia]|uniref:ketopantoate reductase family protein n=1 Tax=unclassified Beijerinckia TaxID=2638183 RepID=UPI000899CA9B|nr:MULTISPECIES: 2-dehydropantoate 2-reductase [unclassified Beijerinckia]MDH7795307.1 2-dehydropantoate 2-reductase [Beijerinckia sp. GAS462]SEB96141.1 ketopantoate reductase [Beijerinckia sp. 28-YEA-48]
MKIAVVGCGAMGSIYAGLLASAGHEVLVIGRSADQMRVLNEHGLRVEGASGDRTVAVRALTEAPQEPVDLVIVAVKAGHIASVRVHLPRLLAPQTVVLTIQNGLGSAQAVAEAVGADRLAVGIAGGFGAIRRGPAHVFHNGMETIRIGAFGGLSTVHLTPVIDAWSGAGFKTELSTNIVAMQWEKLICNVAFSAPCTLTGLTVGEVMDDPEMGPISRAAAVEAWNIGLANGVAIKVKDPVEHALAFGRAVRHAKPSMLQDHEQRRPSEIDVINGAVPREAAKVSLAAPVNMVLTHLVKQRERAFARSS